MPTYFKGTNLKKIVFNDTNLKKVIFNGVTVFQSEITIEWTINTLRRDDGGSFVMLLDLIDYSSLSADDVVTMRVKDEYYGYVEVFQAEATIDNPSALFRTNEFHFEEGTNKIEFLLNGVVKASDTWNHPERYEEYSKTKQISFEP